MTAAALLANIKSYDLASYEQEKDTAVGPIDPVFAKAVDMVLKRDDLDIEVTGLPYDALVKISDKLREYGFTNQIAEEFVAALEERALQLGIDFTQREKPTPLTMSLYIIDREPVIEAGKTHFMEAYDGLQRYGGDFSRAEAHLGIRGTETSQTSVPKFEDLFKVAGKKYLVVHLEKLEGADIGKLDEKGAQLTNLVAAVGAQAAQSQGGGQMKTQIESGSMPASVQKLIETVAQVNQTVTASKFESRPEAAAPKLAEIKASLPQQVMAAAADNIPPAIVKAVNMAMDAQVAKPSPAPAAAANLNSAPSTPQSEASAPSANINAAPKVEVVRNEGVKPQTGVAAPAEVVQAAPTVQVSPASNIEAPEAKAIKPAVSVAAPAIKQSVPVVPAAATNVTSAPSKPAVPTAKADAPSQPKPQQKGAEVAAAQPSIVKPVTSTISQSQPAASHVASANVAKPAAAPTQPSPSAPAIKADSTPHQTPAQPQMTKPAAAPVAAMATAPAQQPAVKQTAPVTPAVSAPKPTAAAPQPAPTAGGNPPPRPQPQPAPTTGGNPPPRPAAGDDFRGPRGRDVVQESPRPEPRQRHEERDVTVHTRDERPMPTGYRPEPPRPVYNPYAGPSTDTGFKPERTVYKVTPERITVSPMPSSEPVIIPTNTVKIDGTAGAFNKCAGCGSKACGSCGAAASISAAPRLVR